MIAVDPEAVLELLDARDYYERARPGLGAVFELAAQRTLDTIEAAPNTFPLHPFARRRVYGEHCSAGPRASPSRSRTSPLRRDIPTF